MDENNLLKKLEEAVPINELVELVRKMISVPSHWDVPTMEEEIVSELADYFNDVGLSFELQPIDKRRSNIIARVQGAGGGRSLALNGHLDTVPPYNMTIDPFGAVIENNRIYGRGAVDMKGPIAAMIMTLLAFKRTGIELKGDLIFTGVLAEETNSDGCETLIESGFRSDGAIVGEPSNREYAIAHRGLEWLEIEIIGKRAHGGIPEAGVNAIVNAAKFILRVQEKIVPRLKKLYHPHMGPSVMNFGRIEGGTQPSTVADRCIIQLDRRYIPVEKLEDVIKDYEDILRELSEEDPDFKWELRRMPSSIMKLYDHVPMETSPDHPLVHAVINSIEKITGVPPKMTTRRGWTDAAILNYYGKIPTVIYGPGDITRSHSSNEYITIEELWEGFKTYCLIAMDFCGVN
ncbi:MAG TPA: M20 family metallopeptidase [Thermoanaerobacterales bacterium]|nr:M20 family metallopeptidase [Thermoanaerobacterales bacterium]